MIGESPAVARRRLRLALRRAREAIGLTQGNVAESLDWSISKVNRIEGGEVTISTTDLRALINLYRITDNARIERLLTDAKTSRRRGWWDEPPIREHVTPAMIEHIQFEAEASVIRVFHGTLVPGLLQTRAYAETIMNYWSDQLPAARRAARVDVRLRRRDHVFNRPDPPRYFLILDESVLLRAVGGPQLMAEQLRELLGLHQSGVIMVRILPLVKMAHLTVLGPFTIFDLGDEENAILYRESILVDEMVNTPEVIGLFRWAFEQVWDTSLSVDASARLIEARAAAMLSEVDRWRPDG